MKNKEKYDLRDISYDLEVDRGGYDFVIYYTSMEIYREFLAVLFQHAVLSQNG